MLCLCSRFGGKHYGGLVVAVGLIVREDANVTVMVVTITSGLIIQGCLHLYLF